MDTIRPRNEITWRDALARARGSSVQLGLSGFDIHLDAIERHERDLRALADDALRARVEALRASHHARPRADVRAEVFALTRDAARRALGQRPYDVQLVAALALDRGAVVEMQTGEGKTLTATMPVALQALAGRGAHVLTFNDYLARRDAEWMGPIYHLLGLSVGTVQQGMDPAARRRAYAADVTYVTAKEAGFDHLRDQLVERPADLVHRPRAFALVDEADSLLIDEAVTPLIISAAHKNELLNEAGVIAQRIVADLEVEADYRTNLRYKEIELTADGRRKLDERAAHLPGLWRGQDRRLELIRQALVAREFFLRDKHYIIVEGKIVIVDEFTGRPMPQRTWREGMHQAIEAKEGLPISDPAETIARLSFQRFFRCFHRLSGMTGTAREAAGELWQVYRLPVISIPTNRRCIREHWPDRFFLTETEKWSAVVDEIERLHATGRPLLVGTRSVLASERLGSMLTERGLEFKLLNATRLKEEAEIIALAGERGRITIATNMAGRGTDIKLGHGVATTGGLHVIATERHESGRVDRQLFGRAARQGDPGSAQAFVSAEDELIRRHLPKPAHRLLERSLKSRLPGNERVACAAFALAQRQAQNLALKQRRAVLRADTWLEESLSFAGGDVV